MLEITVEWLAGMVSEALVARGVDTTPEQEAGHIARWLNTEKAVAWDEGEQVLRWDDGFAGESNPYLEEQ